MARRIVMFGGQGAQSYQMGRQLYDQDVAYRRAMDRCDAITGVSLGRPISGIIFGKPRALSDEFDRFEESGPALLATGYALAATLDARGLMPERLLGYSQGETAAAVVSGALSLEDGFRLLAIQARLCAELSPAGALIAVLAGARDVFALPEIAACAELAAQNAPRHCVVAVLAPDVALVCAGLDRAGHPWSRLPVRYPFHSSAIQRMESAMRSALDGTAFSPPRVPIVSSAAARIVERFDADHVWRTMRAPCLFQATLAGLASEGEWSLMEAGPSGTLAALARACGMPGMRAFPAIDQSGRDMSAVARAVAACAR